MTISGFNQKYILLFTTRYVGYLVGIVTKEPSLPTSHESLGLYKETIRGYLLKGVELLSQKHCQTSSETGKPRLAREA